MLLSHNDRPVGAIALPLKAFETMNPHTTNVANLTSPAALRHPHFVLEHIDLAGIRHFVNETPEVVVGLIKLALTSGRDQIAAVNRHGRGDSNASSQHLAIHNLLNTFNFLHAHNAVVTARRAERHVIALSRPLSGLLLEELNDAFRAVESDLETLLLVDHPELRVN
jgi:hypothetical protein